MFDSSEPRNRSVTAVLGPTNTGKTHYAIERMLGHRTGVIGLPLRLLAREVYDRIVALRGPSVTALVTGEERIVPARAQYWVCTVEAMPAEIGADFLVVDEIQLAADPERGHVFTDRLLHARGLSETLFLGSETMRPRIASLVPGAQFQRRERFSTLTWSGSRKLSRLPARSAVVGFSVEEVYAIAELLRRQRGGAAVVMGALSPRTRNAQVALYQNGDVDYMVATDAIGMGLNLDLRHVAFAGVTKFDGHRHRRLQADELAQIAGRAGRYQNDGTFGVTGDAGPLDEETVAQIENHRFPPLSRLVWRNTRLDFGSVAALLATLEEPPPQPDLARAREADDVAALRALARDPAVADRAVTGDMVRRLWAVCQVPDFRKVGPGEHAALLARIYQFLTTGPGYIPSDWLAAQVTRIDRSDGDIDAISKRLAYIRTWTYVAQRSGWVAEEAHWRDETRAVEDRLSDALHARLTQRFVDRRTSVLLRRLKQRESLVAEVSEGGEVTVEGQFVGRLEGFRFRHDPDATGDEARMLRAASLQALQAEIARRSDRFYNAPDQEIGMTEQGGLMWGEHAVGRLAPGPDTLSPEIRVFVDEMAEPAVAEKVTRRLTHWVNRRIATLFEPLIAMRDDAAITGLARGVAFRLVEALGVIPREEIAQDVKALDQEARAMLRKHGVRFGQYTLFQQAVLKPAPTQLRLVLWGLREGLAEIPSAPPPGLVTIPAVADAPPGYYPRAGYRLAGSRAIRIDMLERLADQIRGRDTRGGFEAAPEMLSITGLSIEGFVELMEALGYRAETFERPRQRPRRGMRAEGAPAQGPAAAAGGTGAAVEAAAAAPLPEPGAAAAPEAQAAPDRADPAAAPEPADPAIPAAAAEAPEPTAAAETPEVGAAAPEPAGEAPAGPAAPVETETWYRFVWAPRRPERHRPPRRDRDGPGARPPRPEARGEGREDRRRDRRPQGGRETLRAAVPDPAAGEPPATEAAAAAAPAPQGPRPREHVPGAERGEGRPRAPREGRPEGRGDRPREAREGTPREATPRAGGPRPGAEHRGPPKGQPRDRGDRRPREEEGGKPRVYSARPAREDRPVDPDNPFAALLALKFDRKE